MNGWPFGPRSDHEYDCDRTLKQCRCFVRQEPGSERSFAPRSKTTCTNSISAVKSIFLASLQDACTKTIPFRGFPLRCNPRLRFAIASRSRCPNHTISPTDIVTRVWPSAHKQPTPQTADDCDLATRPRDKDLGDDDSTSRPGYLQKCSGPQDTRTC